MSTSSSLDSLRDMGIPLRVEDVVLKESGRGRSSILQVEYNTGEKVKVRDLSQLVTYEHMLAGDLSGLALTNNLYSLKFIGNFLLSKSVRIEGGKTCFNMLSGGSRCLGVRSTDGVFLNPSTDIVTNGVLGVGPSNSRWVSAHIERRRVARGQETNRITLHAGTMYLIGNGDAEEQATDQHCGVYCDEPRVIKFVKLDWWREVADEAGITLNVTNDYERPGPVILEKNSSGIWETAADCDTENLNCLECRNFTSGIVKHSGRCSMLSEEQEDIIDICIVPRHAMCEAVGKRYVGGKRKKKLIMSAVRLNKSLKRYKTDQLGVISDLTGLGVKDILKTMARMGEIRREFAAANMCYLLDDSMAGPLVQEFPISAVTLEHAIWRFDSLGEEGKLISEITGKPPMGTVIGNEFHERRTGVLVSTIEVEGGLRVGADHGKEPEVPRVTVRLERSNVSEQRELRRHHSVLEQARTTCHKHHVAIDKIYSCANAGRLIGKDPDVLIDALSQNRHGE